jgi:cytochrome P450 family 4
VCVVSKDCIVPKGATIIIFTAGAHRLEGHWDNPDMFNPDKHLPEKAAERNYYSFIPFSAGPRSCVGKHEKQYEIHIQYAVLLLYLYYCYIYY